MMDCTWAKGEVSCSVSFPWSDWAPRSGGQVSQSSRAPPFPSPELCFHMWKMGVLMVCPLLSNGLQFFLIHSVTINWMLLSVSLCLGQAPRFQRCAWQIWSPKSQYSLTRRKRFHRRRRHKIVLPTSADQAPTVGWAPLGSGHAYWFVVALKRISVNDFLLLDSRMEGGWVKWLCDKWNKSKWVYTSGLLLERSCTCPWGGAIRFAVKGTDVILKGKTHPALLGSRALGSI